LDLNRPWRMRGYGVFHIGFLSYLIWHAESRITVLVGCGTLAAVLLVAAKFEWILLRLRRDRRAT
jgi:hypothetical protein